MAKAITCSGTGTNCRARHARGGSKDKTESREECIRNLCLDLVQTSIWERKKHVQKSVEHRKQVLKWENRH